MIMYGGTLLNRLCMCCDMRRLRVRGMTLQMPISTASACMKEISGIRASRGTQLAVRPTAEDTMYADAARLHGVLSCTFSVSRSLLVSRSRTG